MTGFSYMPDKTDFDRKGSLKTLTTFESCVDISSITIRKRARYGQEPEAEAKGESFYLLIEDGYGMQWSYFRQNMSLDKAQTIASRIPYGKTIFIRGEVAVRKGNTFFNATGFYWPNGESVLLYQQTLDEEVQHDVSAENIDN